MKKYSVIFERVLKKIKLSNLEEKEISKKVHKFVSKINKYKKGNYKIVIGGSFAKHTILRKKRYDVDIFVIFNKTNFPSIELKKILKKCKIKFKILKGSRDYYQIKLDKNIIIELVPTLKIKKPDDAKNITDISFLHIDYILNKIKKNPRLAEEIKLAKSFCYGQSCYGAESYIHGFSGYALEVLISYYGSFLKFIKEASKWSSKKVIDPEKQYKNTKNILEELNESKLFSPLVIVDPVQASRNITAALNREVYEFFIRSCKKFLKKPSENFFFKQDLDIKSWKKQAKKKKLSFAHIKAKAKSSKEDIAGAKLRKLFDFMIYKLQKNGFSIEKNYFDFDEETFDGDFYFLIKKPPKQCIILGPPIKAPESFKKNFKKKWKNTFKSKGRLCAKTQRNICFNSFFKNFLKGREIKEMKIKSVKIIM